MESILKKLKNLRLPTLKMDLQMLLILGGSKKGLCGKNYCGYADSYPQASKK